MSAVAGLLLAAGAGRRMGRPKGLLTGPDGEAWVARAARVLANGGCGPVVVVVGAAAAEVSALVPRTCSVVEATDWAEGMGASLRAGLDAVAGRAGPQVVAAVVGLVDTPGVTADVVRLLVGRALAGGVDGLARAAYGGQPGHPVVLGRAHWAAVVAMARGDAGARGYLAAHDVVLVECGGVGDGQDVDGPDIDGPGPDRHCGASLAAVSTDISRPAPGAAHPALAPQHAHTTRIRDHSRIHPPARRVVLTAVTDEPLDVAAHEAAVDGPESGAVVVFSGNVRNHDGGKPVRGIEYVGHPSAAAVLAEVVAEVTARSEVEAVAVSHRLGELGVGDVALVVAVAAAHRQEAFAAAALLVDEVKHRLPVWKRQLFSDGTDEWVACP